MRGFKGRGDFSARSRHNGWRQKVKLALCVAVPLFWQLITRRLPRGAIVHLQTCSDATICSFKVSLLSHSLIKAICYQRGPIKGLKYLLIFQTFCAGKLPLAGFRTTKTTSSCARQTSFSLLAAQARLSLEHIEYLYGKRLESRSLISKVTCLGPCGGGDGCCWHCLWLLGHIVSSVCPLILLWLRILFSGELDTAERWLRSKLQN